MNQELVRLYNEELTMLRQQGTIFAESHPKIASRLKLGQGAVEDPLVGRLLESTAFLTSKLRYQLAEDNTAMDSDLLQLLYPHYFLPIPACSTIQFTPGDKLEQAYTIPRTCSLVTTVGEKNNCIFSTCYPVTIRPMEITKTSYQREGRITPKLHSQKELKSCLAFTLSTISKETNLAELALDRLRLNINAELPQANVIRELLLNHVKEIILVSGHNSISIPVTAIKPVGFDLEENLLPYLPNSFRGYQLLTEYFAYPEKFMYVDIVDLDKYTNISMQSIELHIYFDDFHSDLVSKVDNTTLQLHSTPIVNIFKHIGEPLVLDHTQEKYHIVPDAQQEITNIEVYRVESFEVSSANYHDRIDCMPYFGRNAAHKAEHYLYWHQLREPCWQYERGSIAGDEVFVSISDFNLDGIDEELSLLPHLLCTNREMPIHIPFGGGQPHWRFFEANHELVANIRCVRGITAPHYPEHKHQRQHVAQHVYLNQIGLSDPMATLENLQLLLIPYQQQQVHQQRLLHEGLISASCKPITIRHPEKFHQGFCRGLHYQLTIDETYFVDNEWYLFGSVLHEFLTKSCSMNGFVKLDMVTRQREKLFSWQPKLGTRPLL